jgi:hypothetical protein
MNAVCRLVNSVSNTWLCLGLAITSVIWTMPAAAQGVDEFGPYGRPKDDKNYESPQHWAAELRFGPYYPQVDSAPGLSGTPLADSLGTGHRVMVGIEGDWQALRVPKILTVGPGFGMGYTVLSHPAVYGYAPNGSSPPTGSGIVVGTASPQNSTLKIWLQWVDAVVRVDALNRNFRIPIVFTAKLGMGQALWWAGKGNLAGRDPTTGTIGHGRSWGPTWALGIMFDLNFMQPERARHLDEISDINHMYLFAEWYQFKLDGFGSQDQLRVGDSDWVIGYALEF